MSLRRAVPLVLALAVFFTLAVLNGALPDGTSAGLTDGTSAGLTDGTSAGLADGTSAGLQDETGVSSGGQFSGLDTVTIAELPVEALTTLDLIANDGPYPFDRDDLTFQNREAILPDRPRGHYREYTVITPGESDRGARRIVSGADGELYYTADHYASFREIVG